MHKLLFVLLVASGCGSNALHPDSSEVAAAPDIAQAGCGAALDSVCDDTTCEVMGQNYPATLSGWCALDRDEALDGVSASRNGEASCHGFKVVSPPLGDQSLSLVYDASGHIVAIVRYGSVPPCEGACAAACVTGPAGLDVSAFDQCIADSFLTCGA